MKTHTKVHLFSLKKDVGSLFILLMLTSCSFAQKQDDPSPKNQPNVHIDVKRQLDENGNVIRYDSTYSWSWSNADGNINDSLFSQFFPKSNFMFDRSFSLLDNDSAFFKPFDFPSFQDPFFDFNMDQNMQEMFKRHQQLIQEQQEMINKLLKQQPTPSLKPKTDQPNNSTPKKKENTSTNKNDNQRQGVDL
ncbi:MAG TPA: hypothetical protein PKG63_00910 [Bacteroidales bacterium]|jgi:hypothetical protein|nr:hypothetical protein [Bacteroidales bacterium]